LGLEPSGVEVSWYISQYKSEDQVNFYLEKPYIAGENLVQRSETDEGGEVYTYTFQIKTNHPLTNVDFEAKMNQYLSNIEQFKFVLEYQYEGEWKEVPSYSYDVSNKLPKVIGEWDSIQGNSSLTFRMVATQVDTSLDQSGTYIIFGVGIGVIAELIYVVIAWRQKLWKEQGTIKTILYGIGVGVAGFFGGYFLGMLMV
jgi:hypothetical protein